MESRSSRRNRRLTEIPLILVAAPNMAVNADAFRTDFVNNHLNTLTAYPITKALRGTNLRPRSEGEMRRLLQRTELKIKVKNVRNQPTGQKTYTIENNIGAVVETAFEPMVNNASFKLRVNFPKPLQATLTAAATDLSFVLDTPLLTTFDSKPAIENADRIPRQVTLTSFAVSEKNITYGFSDRLGSALLFFMVLDFKRDIPAPMMVELGTSNVVFDMSVLRAAATRAGKSKAGVRMMSSGGCGDGGTTNPDTIVDDSLITYATLPGGVGRQTTVVVRARNTSTTRDATATMEWKMSVSGGAVRKENIQISAGSTSGQLFKFESNVEEKILFKLVSVSWHTGSPEPRTRP